MTVGSTTVKVSLEVNGRPRRAEVEARTLLVYFLREHLGLTGTHVGCDTSNCGACTVLLDGRAVKSCTVLAVQADGCAVDTVESLAPPDGPLNRVQEGFRQEHGLQCGYCTPGMLMATTSLLRDTPDPSEAEIREALEGNLCRCTGYEMIVRSVRWAAEHPDGLEPDVLPAPFRYLRADSMAAALDALVEHGDDAKLLAGGHSLLPLMKLRLARPEVIVDIGRLDDLRYVRSDGDSIRIGALTTIRDIERDPTVAEHVPLLAAAAHAVGDPQVRARGTIGGSLSHGDGASDLPAVALAVGATVVVTGQQGAREVPADDFFRGFLETAVGSDELVTEIVVPKCGDAGWSFQKFNRRAQDWAIVGVALVHGNGDGPTGIGLVNMASTPIRAHAAEAVLRAGGAPDDVGAAAADGTDPASDLHASAAYRQHLARVLVARAAVGAST